MLSLFLPFKMVSAKDKVVYAADSQKLLAATSPTPQNTNSSTGTKTPATTNSGGFKTPEGAAGVPGTGESAPPVSSSIRNALSPGGGAEWVITSWKVVLGLANLALVAILVFLAAVNVLNISYDTYAIKKVLPILIIGVLLADFSLLIIRMLLDFSNILTVLFTNPDKIPGGQTPAEFAKNLISCAHNAMGTSSSSSADLNCKPMEFGAAKGLGVLFIWFLFSLLLMVAFFILGFLFYIRYAVIITCAIAAPLAFIAMAFPPTQGFFKQWWGWLTKFIFMKPIAFFFLWLAWQIKGTGVMGSITGWMILAFLVIVAVIIPFKLGGSVMAGWSKAGQWLTGTKAGGYIRKPIDNFIQSKKDAWKERANLGAEKYLKYAGYDLARKRQQHVLTMERLKNERTRVADESQVKLRAKLGQRLGEEKARQARAKTDIEDIEKINDILDREVRGEKRTKDELRDRVVAAAHNAVTKKWMHQVFQERTLDNVGKTWEPFVSDVGKYIKEEEAGPFKGKKYAEALGRIEGKSGEMDRGIEKVNSDAMLNIAGDKLKPYYTEFVVTIDKKTGAKGSGVDALQDVRAKIAEYQLELNDLDKDRDKAEYDEISVKIRAEKQRGQELILQARSITKKDEKGNDIPDPTRGGKPKLAFTKEDIRQMESYLKGMRRVKTEEGPE